jgi:hypothetical protein
VRANHVRFMMVVKGKTRLARPVEAPCAGSKVWESMVWHGVGDDSAWKR